MAQNHNQLRIIGGEWRGRKLRFPDAPNLRPTPDRVRETIFNWLSPTINGARCLDLFAGSGALGLEALSRGAATSTFVDSHHKAIESLKDHVDLLHAHEKAKLFQMDAIKFLNSSPSKYDVVFLDPPYQLPLLEKVIPLLESNHWLNHAALLYVEIEKRHTLPEIPLSWTKLKEKTAGDVNYYLFQKD